MQKYDQIADQFEIKSSQHKTSTRQYVLEMCKLRQ